MWQGSALLRSISLTLFYGGVDGLGAWSSGNSALLQLGWGFGLRVCPLALYAGGAPGAHEGFGYGRMCDTLLSSGLWAGGLW